MSNSDKEFIRKTGTKTDDVSLVTEKGYERGKHPNSQANLEPYEKGISGNPDGRPKKYLKLKKALDRIGKEKKNAWDISGMDKDNYKDEVTERIWYEASKGSVAHIRMLAELGCLDEED
jgi:hypothetical protein